MSRPENRLDGQSRTRDLVQSHGFQRCRDDVTTPVAVFPPREGQFATHARCGTIYAKRGYFALIALCLAGLITGCDDMRALGKTSLPYTSFHFRLDEGAFIGHSYYITNNSGHDLVDVDIVFTSIGLNGDRKHLKRFWSTWRDGVTKEAHPYFSNDEAAYNVQSIEVNGYSTEYSFDFVVRYKN